METKKSKKMIKQGQKPFSRPKDHFLKTKKKIGVSKKLI
jgi:hypothetical protein